ncbi:MAG: MBL fold metallo-hydrolase [Pseudomonadota bacterium]
MRPNFFNSADIDTPEWLILRGGTRKKRRLKVRYGVFEHPTRGPVLIDTGYTSHAVTSDRRRFLLRLYSKVLNPKLNPAGDPETALASLGLTPSDIAGVIVTHFHADHVSGLALFPKAEVIASGKAYRRIAANSQLRNIRHGVFPELLPSDLATRLRPVETCKTKLAPPFSTAWDLFGDSSILAIPLPGHADGQIGLLFPNLAPPLLYAADAQWLIDALSPGKRPGAPSCWIADDAGALASTTDHVAAFRDAGGEVVMCHDDAPSPYDAVQGPG